LYPSRIKMPWGYRVSATAQPAGAAYGISGDWAFAGAVAQPDWAIPAQASETVQGSNPVGFSREI
jgi:hypothetical protein